MARDRGRYNGLVEAGPASVGGEGDDGECGVSAEVKICVACGRHLSDRVEEEEKTRSNLSRSTGECDTYRVWFCENPECEMYKSDLYRDQIAQR